MKDEKGDKGAKKKEKKNTIREWNRLRVSGNDRVCEG